MNRCARPVRPCVPMTIRSTWRSRASRQISTGGYPTRPASLLPPTVQLPGFAAALQSRSGVLFPPVPARAVACRQRRDLIVRGRGRVRARPMRILADTPVRPREKSPSVKGSCASPGLFPFRSGIATSKPHRVAYGAKDDFSTPGAPMARQRLGPTIELGMGIARSPHSSA
jgi:hypothetical protein